MLTVTVNGRNDSPTANPDTASISEDASVAAAVLANDSDPDTLDVLTVSVGSGLGRFPPTAPKSSTIRATRITIWRWAKSAIVVINYTISDGHGGTSGSSLTVTVNGLNDAPTANPDSASTDRGRSYLGRGADRRHDPDTSDVLGVISVIS